METEAQKQINELARFILEEVLGEPSQNEGAIECAMRLIRAKYVV